MPYPRPGCDCCFRYGIKNLASIVGKEVKIQGFIVSTWAKEFPTAVAALAAWLMKGQLQFHETVIDGFENVSHARPPTDAADATAHLTHTRTLVRHPRPPKR